MITMGADRPDIDVEAAWRRELGRCCPPPGKDARRGGWCAEMPVIAYVVSIRHATYPAEEGLLQPLLRRWKAGGCSAGVFRLPAVEAVIDYKWSRFARRLLLAELALFCIWLVAHHTLALVAFADAGVPLRSTLAGRRGVLVAAAQLVPLAALAPFLALDCTTLAAYGARHLLSPWTQLSLATYALQASPVVMPTLALSLLCWGQRHNRPRVDSLLVLLQQVDAVSWPLLYLGLLMLSYATAFIVLFQPDRASHPASKDEASRLLLSKAQAIDELESVLPTADPEQLDAVRLDAIWRSVGDQTTDMLQRRSSVAPSALQRQPTTEAPSIRFDGGSLLNAYLHGVAGEEEGGGGGGEPGAEGSGDGSEAERGGGRGTAEEVRELRREGQSAAELIGAQQQLAQSALASVPADGAPVPSPFSASTPLAAAVPASTSLTPGGAQPQAPTASASSAPGSLVAQLAAVQVATAGSFQSPSSAAQLPANAAGQPAGAATARLPTLGPAPTPQLPPAAQAPVPSSTASAAPAGTANASLASLLANQTALQQLVQPLYAALGAAPAGPSAVPPPAPSPPPCKTDLLNYLRSGQDTAFFLSLGLLTGWVQRNLSSPDLAGTLLLPTDAALSAFLADQGIGPGDLVGHASQLESVLAYHWLPQPLSYTDLARRPSSALLRTGLPGSFLAVRPLNATALQLVGAASSADIVRANILVCTTVVHVINNVLQPAPRLDQLSIWQAVANISGINLTDPTLSNITLFAVADPLLQLLLGQTAQTVLGPAAVSSALRDTQALRDSIQGSILPQSLTMQQASIRQISSCRLPEGDKRNRALNLSDPALTNITLFAPLDAAMQRSIGELTAAAGGQVLRSAQSTQVATALVSSFLVPEALTLGQLRAMGNGTKLPTLLEGHDLAVRVVPNAISPQARQADWAHVLAPPQVIIGGGRIVLGDICTADGSILQIIDAVTLPSNLSQLELAPQAEAARPSASGGAGPPPMAITPPAPELALPAGAGLSPMAASPPAPEQPPSTATVASMGTNVSLPSSPSPVTGAVPAVAAAPAACAPSLAAAMASNPQLSILQTALGIASFDLSDPALANVTLFAPLDAALLTVAARGQVLQARAAQNSRVVAALIAFFLVPEELTLEQLRAMGNGTELPTLLEGHDLSVQLLPNASSPQAPPQVVIGGGRIVQGDICIADGSILHIIDAVPVPSNLSQLELAPQAELPGAATLAPEAESDQSLSLEAASSSIFSNLTQGLASSTLSCLSIGDFYATSPDFQSFYRLISGANLQGLFASSPASQAFRFTSLAPVNSAVDSFLASLEPSVRTSLLASRDAIVALFSFHALVPPPVMLADMADGKTLPTFALDAQARRSESFAAHGNNLMLTVHRPPGGTIQLQGAGTNASVLYGDIPVCEGIVDAVDTVLLPTKLPGSSAAAPPSSSAVAGR
eukprot:scaffold17.g535.t1